MKLAILSVTYKGAKLAARLAAALDGEITVFAKAGRCASESQIAYEQLGGLIQTIFSKFDGLIFIMATGIAVRVIAPEIQNKRVDPAVVVIDDGACHAISLLSGHLGGANDLARRVAAVSGAEPVITTATDVAHKPAADTLAVKLGLAIEPFEELKGINAAIVNEDRVIFCLDDELKQALEYCAVAQEMGVDVQPLKKLTDQNDYDRAVVITDKDLYMFKPHLYLRPATLAVGIGCRRDTESALIYEALRLACKKIGRSIHSIAVLASIDIKNDEIGLLSVSQQLALPLQFFNQVQLAKAIETYQLDESGFVKKQIGVGNVCEAAALLSGRSQKLLLSKTKYPKVTIAIAEVSSLSLV